MHSSDFGPFAELFEPREGSVGGYLQLLNLSLTDDANDAIDRITRALAAPDASQSVGQMLSQMDWRPHLVAAVACLVNSDEMVVEDLWCTLDRGSWVTPQLVVVALLVDPDFPERAMSRVARRCPIAMPPGLPPMEPHLAARVDRGRSAKMLASVLEAALLIPRMATWRAEIQSIPDIMELLKRNAYDQSDTITRRWFHRICAIFAARGVALVPKAE